MPIQIRDASEEDREWILDHGYKADSKVEHICKHLKDAGGIEEAEPLPEVGAWPWEVKNPEGRKVTVVLCDDCAQKIKDGRDQIDWPRRPIEESPLYKPVMKKR